MIPQIPRQVLIDPAYKPLLSVLEAVHLKASEVSRHLRLEESTLNNWRRRGTGLPFIKLPSGRVLYPVDGVVSWQIAGAGGPATLERVALALATVQGLSPEMRERIEQTLQRLVFGGTA